MAALQQIYGKGQACKPVLYCVKEGNAFEIRRSLILPLSGLGRWRHMKEIRRPVEVINGSGCRGETPARVEGKAPPS